MTVHTGHLVAHYFGHDPCGPASRRGTIKKNQKQKYSFVVLFICLRHLCVMLQPLWGVSCSICNGVGVCLSKVQKIFGP